MLWFSSPALFIYSEWIVKHRFLLFYWYLGLVECDSILTPEKFSLNTVMSRDNPSNTEKTWRCILRSGSGHVSMALFNNFKSKSQGIRCRIDIRVLCSFVKTHCSVQVTFQWLYLSWQPALVCDFTVYSRWYRDRKLVSCKRGTPYVYL